MRRLLTLAIPIILGVGMLAAAFNSPEGEQQAAPRRQGGVTTESTLPAVIEEPVASTTTTTVAAPAPETPTTTVPPTTTTTAKRTVLAPAPRPATTTTTVAAPPLEPTQSAAPSTIDCGTGSAKAQAKYFNVDGKYQVSVTVVNEATKAIELDSLVVRAVYSSGEKFFTVNVAGRRIEAGPSGNEAVFSIPESASDAPPNPFGIADFRFHTAGLPECASRSSD